MIRYLSSKLIFLLILCSHILQSQQKYWVNVEDTRSTTISNILPDPEVCSEWLHTCSYLLTDEQISQLQHFEIAISPVLALYPQKNYGDKITFGFALEQIEAQSFIDQNLNGAGVKIGIIDGGFLKADSDPSLAHFFENDLVKWYKDYVTPEMEDYGGSMGLDDNHGTEVWRLIGGYHPDKNIQYGLATASEYYLARTDHGAYEKRIEEDYMIKTLEEMEKKGVRLVNISLGYNLGFKSPESNYKVEQMDGKTTKLALAVEHAALEKGMLIVVAAGNDAKTKWKIIDTPADAEHALTVGSSKFKIWDKMDYSSIGPDFTNFVKPDIAVYSTMGTSYATPIITGMAACLWQMNPSLTNLQIIDIFKRAGNFYPYPNNYLGYGVPTASKLLKVMNGDSLPKPEIVKTNKPSYRLKIKSDEKYIVVFHKKDKRNVIGRVIYRPRKDVIKIKRIEGAVESSVLIGQEVIEIFWE